ncbi:TetR family transcriptional regulator [Virgibacillus profundi]|uniref:TetR family transcriptional regulator n=1 Tax=Virgibacillus profundi TaxID=2024555 RepID=A0A2A2IEE4_9BACI|nr:TetR-like C-terminal domain-containing protein [Virgibacillus profundi]PAV29624.1 TetR family transcriptional regulator [Virgibacillus profundi]PXY53796.1 TetR/AcrR family transcriptional regulator [Virgibacillus profundi]
MTSDKLDRRKKYTRMVLKDSLMKLLKEKQISTITVKEICELADINRSTFYAHYSDQFDLLEQIEEELIEEMIMYLRTYDFEKEDEALQMTERLIKYFASKQDECQTLLNENVDSSFEKKVMVVAQRFIMKDWMEVKHLDEDISEYLSTFIVSGSIQVMKVWLNNGMDKSPKEMAEIIINVINKGILGLR